jgi:hypothetical protein
MTPARQGLALIAAVSACGAQEVVFALPTPANKIQGNAGYGVWFLSALVSPADSFALALARHGDSKPKSDRVVGFHRSAASQFSFDSFVFLRV